MAFTDNFNRADAALESSGSWTLDSGDTAASLNIVSNQLSNANTSSPGAAYKAPDQGSTRHYVQAKIANVTSGTGPFICCRLTDKNNFLGVRVGDPGIGTGTIEVYRRISGSLTSLYLSPSGTVSVNDIIRLECVEGTWALFRNGRYVTGGLVGSVPSTTRTGLVGRASTFNPWIDDFETGAVPRDIADDFNRSDEYLEFSAASSSGQYWRYDYNVANGGGIRSNQFACTNSDGEGSLYFWNTGVQEQYIRFTIQDTTANSFVVLRCNDRLNWVGCRANGSDLQLYQRVSGSFTSFYSVNHGITAGDVIEIRTSGVKDLLVYKNSSLIATVTTGPSLTGTNVGIHVRQSVQNPFLDNFAGGELTASAQDIDPAFFASSGQFFAYTVQPVYTISPPFYDKTSQFFAYTVTTGAVDINAPFFDNANRFFAFSVTQDAAEQDINAPFLSRPGQFFSFAVVGNIEAPFYDRANQFFAYTVTPGDVTINFDFWSTPNRFFSFEVHRQGDPDNVGGDEYVLPYRRRRGR